jgi:A/G-specific adenine glycosylase
MSELMLQQTQVDRVISLYKNWLKIFPTWQSLANAKTAELIHAWAGLGYNRRALFAREAAKSVVQNGVPGDEASWRQLKGVGPYMAAALSEFVNGKRAIVIDTNVRRVAGRLFLGNSFPSIQDDVELRKTLERITPKNSGHADLPQAFMDLGSSVCTPNRPICETCPMKRVCASAPKFLSGRVQKPKRKKITERIHGEKPFPDRIYRGRILQWIRINGATSSKFLGENIDSTYDQISDLAWIEAMCERLINDGFLVRKRNGMLSLSQSS